MQQYSERLKEVKTSQQVLHIQEDSSRFLAIAPLQILKLLVT